MFLSSLSEKLANLSDNPGVYIFKDSSGQILYIGKATSLKNRIKSYFNGSDERGERIFSMVSKASDIKTIETESVLEALILEANLIKKFQPKYNIKERDDKSFSFIVLTKEEFPRFLILRETDLKAISYKLPPKADQPRAEKAFGPYTSKKQLEIALNILRKIFPFHSNKQKTEKGCLDFQIGKCPGPYAGAISRKDYLKNIRGIQMILEGKKKNLVKKMEKEMGGFSKKHEFEKAAEIRNKIFALQHIQDIALISKDDKLKAKSQKLKAIRIEAYDISNISGQYAVGSMVVFENDEPNKNEYRKFKIKTVAGSNDVGMMAEVLFRRFRNNWPKPDLILLDGGIGHLNMAEKVLKELNINIPIVAVAKGKSRKNLKLQISNSKKIQNSKLKIQNFLNNKNIIKNIMDEAHRFAIGYHKKLRKSNFLRQLFTN